MLIPPEWFDRLLFSPAGQAAAAALWDLAAVAAPVACVVCGSVDRSLCPACAAAVRRRTLHPFQAQDGAAALPAAEQPPGLPRADHDDPLPVLAAGAYGGGLARILLAFKNRGHTDLTGFLVPVLAGVLRAAAAQASLASGSERLVLVPVPGSAHSRRRRGYLPLAVLMRAVTRRGLLPPECSVLPLVRYRVALPAFRGGRKGPRRTQKGLGSGGRRRNVRDTMAARRPGLEGLNCVVVDDVLTTGATVGETVRALRAAGAHVWCAAVIAATPAPARNTFPTSPDVAGAPLQGDGNGIRGRE